MRMKRAAISLVAAAGVATLVFTGVALAGPMAGGMPGVGMGSGVSPSTGTTTMQRSTTQLTTRTNMMQHSTGASTGTGAVNGMGPGAGMGFGPGPSTGTGNGSGPGNGNGYMFMDVMSSDWFAQYAQDMASHGFMNGFANGTFGPQLPITRGEFCAILGRMMNLQQLSGTSFTDTQGYWAAGMIQAMAHLGIVAGHADGTFDPNGLITREQMATFMDRAWEAIHGNATSTDMLSAMTQMMQLVHDASGSWAAPHIAHMMQLGVFVGSNGMFHPTDTATRAQAAAVMWRWFTAGQSQQ